MRLSLSVADCVCIISARQHAERAMLSPVRLSVRISVTRVDPSKTVEC